MALIEGKGVSKAFGALRAVDQVDFHIESNEILGLIGPNGAGKTTLVNLITGVYPVTEGEISFKREKITGLRPARVSRLGIARTFQIVKPFPGMTVRENVVIGALFGKNGAGRSTRAAFQEADRWIDYVHLQDHRYASVDQINISDRKRMDLAKALAMGPELLMLDEVMAGLNTDETREVIGLVQSVSRRLNIGVGVVEHVMGVIRELTHRVIVLENGEIIAAGPYEEVSRNPRVIEAYLGGAASC